MKLRQQVIINIYDNNGDKEIKIVSKDYQQPKRVGEAIHIVLTNNSTEVFDIKELLEEVIETL